MRLGRIVSHTRSYAVHLGRDLRNGVGAGHVRGDLRRFRQWFTHSPAVSSPPHDLALYRRLLEDLLADPRCRVADYAQAVVGDTDPERATVVLRHDVDYGDEASTRALCEVERDLGLSAAVHVQADCSAYDAASLKSMVADLRAEGFDVGLHSTCWVAPDPPEALRTELAAFGETFGFAPATFSLHGVWPHTRADVWRRRWLTMRIGSVIADTSLLGYRHVFDWVSEDSNVLGRPADLRQSFFEVAERCFLGGVALVLTHDTHWQAG